ncbi:MAG: MBL fold metallo-hydrolase [Burkholderiaceae bacterium]
MEFASLGSGSEGNALVIRQGPGPGGVGAIGRERFLLLDCGFGLKEATARMARLGLQPDNLAGILVTHEHSDHVGGVFRLARRTGAPIFITSGTLRGCQVPDACRSLIRVIDAHTAFDWCDWRIEPFPVPHDAHEPVQYVIDDGRSRLGVLTDLGHPTPHLSQALCRLDALVLETNHDAGLLASSHYPPSLRARISGRYGHLENQDAAEILRSLDAARLQVVVAAHLSRHNNRAELAQKALSEVLGWRAQEVKVADQDQGLDWVAC